MEFTYDSYRRLLYLLAQHGYQTADYHNWKNTSRCVIIRHDIDNSLDSAVEFAMLEQEFGVKSTYFVLVSTDFYNVFSRKSREQIQCIQSAGHTIGLHFDEVAYPGCVGEIDKIQERILQEAHLLQNVTGTPVTTVSMHRPSEDILSADLRIPGIVNSYSKLFFKQFKYLSDSRCNWREPVLDIIESEQYSRIHLLTHAFWYHSNEQNITKTVSDFIKSGNLVFYHAMQENISDLDSILK